MRTQTKDIIKASTFLSLLGIAVALVSLGVFPRCDNIQTVTASDKTHAELREKDKELQSQINKIHEKQLDYFKQIMRRLERR